MTCYRYCRRRWTRARYRLPPALSQPDTNVLVLGEIRKGIERVKIDDPKCAKALERWMATLATSYSDRILPIDLVVAEEWGHMSVKRPVPTIDTLLAATAKVHELMLVTRDIAECG